MLYFWPGISPAIIAERSMIINFPNFGLFHLEVLCRHPLKMCWRLKDVLMCYAVQTYAKQYWDGICTAGNETSLGICS